MSRRAIAFTQAEIARAIRAVADVGAPVAVLLLPDKSIRVEPLGERDKNSGGRGLPDLAYEREPRL